MQAEKTNWMAAGAASDEKQGAWCNVPRGHGRCAGVSRCSGFHYTYDSCIEFLDRGAQWFCLMKRMVRLASFSVYMCICVYDFTIAVPAIPHRQCHATILHAADTLGPVRHGADGFPERPSTSRLHSSTEPHIPFRSSHASALVEVLVETLRCNLLSRSQHAHAFRAAVSAGGFKPALK